MITPTLKDKVLEYIINNSPDMMVNGDLDEWSATLDINGNTLNEILLQFHKKDMMTYRPFMGGGFLIQVHAGAHDYYLAGGHVGEIEMFEMEFKKLSQEIASLQQQIPKSKFEYLTGSINTLMTFFTTVYRDR